MDPTADVRFTRMYEAYYPDVLAYCARRVNRTDAEDVANEVFAVLWLNNRHHMLAFDEMFYGTIDGASVHPREVVRRAIEHNAAAVILAHNHPSGVAEPSRADTQLTRRLSDALGLIDVRVIDHIVVGAEETVSFAERGLI